MNSARRLEQLQAQLAQIVAEVQALKAQHPMLAVQQYSVKAMPGMPGMLGMQGMPARYQMNPQGVTFTTPGATSVKGQEDLQMLTRGTYKLPGVKAEALAAFLKDQVTADVETKVDGDTIKITTTPEAQSVIGNFIRLLQSADAGKSSVPATRKTNPKTSLIDGLEDKAAATVITPRR